MSESPRGTLYELIISDVIAAAVVCKNSLVFDRLFADYLASAPATRALDHRRVDSLRQLETDIESKLIARGSRLLERAEAMTLKELARERAAMGRDFARIMSKAGVVHDNLNAAAAMTAPDMTQGWRRFDVTDQHAAKTLTEIGDLVARQTLQVCDSSPVVDTALREPTSDPQPAQVAGAHEQTDADPTPAAPERLEGHPEPSGPSVMIDFRHFHEIRNIWYPEDEGVPPEHYHVVMPLWVLHLMRIAVGIVAHECAHPASYVLVRQIREGKLLNTRRNREFKLNEIIDEIERSLLPSYVDTPVGLDTEQRQQLISEVAEGLVSEVVTDALAFAILGPTYIVNLAVYLIGAHDIRPRHKQQRQIRRTPLSVRLRLLMDIYQLQHESEETAPGITVLLDEVRRSTEEYYDLRYDSDLDLGFWLEFQDVLVRVLKVGVAELLRDHIANHRAIVKARKHRTVAAYHEAWKKVGGFVKAAGGSELLEKLSDFAEAKVFFKNKLEEGLKTKKIWSLDRVWLRGRKNTRKPQQLIEWLQGLAKPKQDSEQPSIYSLLLGNADAVVLRPNFRLRQPVSLELPDTHELHAYVERRALLEIESIKSSSDDERPWKPRPWNEARPCVIMEVRLKERQPRDFLRMVLAHEDELELVRAYITAGWADLVLLLRPLKVDRWLALRQELFGDGNCPLERSISCLLTDLQVIDPRGDSKPLVNPWEDLDEHDISIRSRLRLGEAGDLEKLLNERQNEKTPKIASLDPIYGIEDAVADFNVSSRDLRTVTQWLYDMQVSDLITRSVSMVVIKESEER